MYRACTEKVLTRGLQSVYTAQACAERVQSMYRARTVRVKLFAYSLMVCTERVLACTESVQCMYTASTQHNAVKKRL